MAPTCRRCDSPLRARTKFCVQCGAPVSSPSAPAAAPRRVEVPGRALLIGVALVLVVGGAWYWWPAGGRIDEGGGAWSRALDAEDLPAPRNGGQIVAAREFGPDGDVGIGGFAATFPLDGTQPPGTRLWVAHLDAGGVWRSTGERAVVLPSGREAHARLFHFSTYAVMTRPELTVDRRTMRTEWVWLLTERQLNLERLAQNLAEKYAERLGVAPGHLSRPEAWDPEQPRAFQTANPECYQSGAREFADKSRALDDKLVEAVSRWTNFVGEASGGAASSSGSLDAAVALYDAAGDLATMAQIFEPSLDQKAWGYVRDKIKTVVVDRFKDAGGALMGAIMDDAVRQLPTDAVERFLQVDRRTAERLRTRVRRNAFVQGQIDSAREALSEPVVTASEAAGAQLVDAVFGEVTPDTIGAMADGFVSRADDLLLGYARVHVFGESAAASMGPASTSGDLLRELRGPHTRAEGFRLAMSLDAFQETVAWWKARQMEWVVWGRAAMRTGDATETVTWTTGPWPGATEFRVQMTAAVLDDPAAVVSLSRPVTLQLIGTDGALVPNRNRTVTISTNTTENPTNLPQLRQDFQTFKRELADEVTAGTTAFDAWVASTSREDARGRARALVALRLQAEDARHMLQWSVPRLIKEELKKIASGESELPGVDGWSYESTLSTALRRTRGIRGATRAGLELALGFVVDALIWGQNELSGDALDEALDTVAARTYDVAGLVLTPDIEPVFVDEAALREFLTLPACFHSEKCLTDAERQSESDRKRLLCTDPGGCGGDAVMAIVCTATERHRWQRAGHRMIRGSGFGGGQLIEMVWDPADGPRPATADLVDYEIWEVDASRNDPGNPLLWPRHVIVYDLVNARAAAKAIDPGSMPGVDRITLDGADQATLVPGGGGIRAQYRATVGRYFVVYYTGRDDGPGAGAFLNDITRALRGLL